ncbi:uncharacterized protein L201_000820 [Kwoniella dendrophila CBS 6074]|uniref:Uncharacterized protein n=1 Tax=Kwoniella dendrophila CBS 6074 TaxID=1295534 RepID=A0AAX4JN44_9TREE
MTYQSPQPPSSFNQPTQYQQQRHGSIRKMPSAKEIASTSSFVSPLTRLGAQGRSARSRANSASNSTVPSSLSNSYTSNYRNPTSIQQPIPNPEQQSSSSNPPPVPTLEFGNLFRNSRYSVDSLSSVSSRDSFDSYGSISQNEEGYDDGYESPSTPKASTSRQAQQSYFESQQQQRNTATPAKQDDDLEESLHMRDTHKNRLQPSSSSSTINLASSSNSGSLTPKKSFSVKSRPMQPPPVKPIQLTNVSQSPSYPAYTSTSTTPYTSQPHQPVFNLGSIPSRGNRNRSGSDALAKQVPVVHQAEETEVSADWASVHGEQGSDWGDDESQFEWLDTDNVPEAINGVEGSQQKSGQSSPSKRLSKLKAAVSVVGAVGIGSATTGEGVSRKLKKPLIIHRRAPPPPPNTAPAPPSASLPRSEPNSPIKKSSSIPSIISHPTSLIPGPRPAHNSLPKRAGTLRSASSNSTTPTLKNQRSNAGEQQYKYSPKESDTDIFRPPQAPFNTNGPKRPSPLMVPMKMDDGPNPAMMGDNESRHSQMSFQSVAYSYYDLDGGQSPVTTPKPTDESSNGTDLVFPNGKYVKVSASALEKQKLLQNERERKLSQTSSNIGWRSGGDGGKTPDEYVHAGLEARGKGDLSKSAWYFMKAAEGGSPTGRMYWGLALRHGWGIARDERKAFMELRQACDETIAEGGLDFHKSPGHKRLTEQQKKSMQKELSLGMFEVGNCFLEGVGVKKAPDVALAYLKYAAGMGDVASQEQMGFLLSKGSNGIKKDMKEAARWYRMAIANGSSNTFGLAWIWKDKYMT